MLKEVLQDLENLSNYIQKLNYEFEELFNNISKFKNLLEDIPLEKEKPEKTIPEKELDEYDFSTKEKTIKAILQECKKQGLNLEEQQAYVLATVDHETKHTFKPVKEAYWLSEDWRKKNLKYYPFYGRGFVQITWKENYKKYSDMIGYDFVNDPDAIMEPNTSLFILVHGMKNGIFTGKKLENYITFDGEKGLTDFINARRVVNGTDKAKEIAQLAEKYLQEIKNERYS